MGRRNGPQQCFLRSQRMHKSPGICAHVGTGHFRLPVMSEFEAVVLGFESYIRSSASLTPTLTKHASEFCPYILSLACIHALPRTRVRVHSDSHARACIIFALSYILMFTHACFHTIPITCRHALSMPFMPQGRSQCAQCPANAAISEISTSPTPLDVSTASAREIDLRSLEAQHPPMRPQPRSNAFVPTVI